MRVAHFNNSVSLFLRSLVHCLTFICSPTTDLYLHLWCCFPRLLVCLILSVNMASKVFIHPPKKRASFLLHDVFLFASDSKLSRCWQFVMNMQRPPYHPLFQKRRKASYSLVYWNLRHNFELGNKWTKHNTVKKKNFVKSTRLARLFRFVVTFLVKILGCGDPRYKHENPSISMGMYSLRQKF